MDQFWNDLYIYASSGFVTNLFLVFISFSLISLKQTIHKYYLRDFHGIHDEDN